MRKLAFSAIIITSTFLVSGCDFGNQSSSAEGSIMKSTDGGKTWENKVKIDEKKSIAGADVLAMAIDPGNSQVICIGTKGSGIFKTENGGESWKNLDFPPAKIYGLSIDNFNSQVVYATGVWQERGKIYKSEDGGNSWKEIYTEPANGTVVISLAANPNDGNVLYAGTNEGAIFKTANGGETWANLFKAKEAVNKIAFDAANGEIVYFNLFESNILRTKDGGKTFDDLEKNIKGGKIISSNARVFAVVPDPSQAGVIYAGLDKGMLKSADYGDTWNQIETLESSREFPIMAIAISPGSSREIIYSAAQAVYKSVDGGKEWSTFQLQTSKVVSLVQYDRSNPSTVYLGTKNPD